jgi:hypothetical protein
LGRSKEKDWAELGLTGGTTGRWPEWNASADRRWNRRFPFTVPNYGLRPSFVNQTSVALRDAMDYAARCAAKFSAAKHLTTGRTRVGQRSSALSIPADSDAIIFGSLRAIFERPKKTQRGSRL